MELIPLAGRLRRVDPGLLGILLVAAVLRVLHIGRDLPYVLHFDEPTLVDNAVWMWTNHTLHPHFFNYPTGMIYLLAALFGIAMAAGMLAGGLASPGAALAWLSAGTYPRPPEGGVLYFYPTIGVPALYLIGRSVSALAGCVTVALVYGIARAAGARASTARFAALLYAISPLAVEHARFVTTDTAAGMFAAACLLATLRAHDGGPRRGWIVAGALAGLAAGFKYNAGFVAAGIALAAIARGRHPQRRAGAAGDLGMAAAAGLLAFLVTTPFALADPGRFLHDIRYEALRVGTGAGAVAGLERESGFARVLSLLYGGLTPMGIGAVVVGAIGALRSGAFRRLLLVALPLLGLVPLLTGTIVYARYLVPLWPPLVVLAAIGVLEPPIRMERAGIAPGVARGTTVTLAILMAMSFCTPLARRERERARPDPRIAMTAWAREHIPQGERIVAEPGGIFPAQERFTIDQVDFLGRHDPAFYRARGIRWLAGSGRERLVRGRDAYAEVLRNRAALEAEARLVWSEGQYTIHALGSGVAWEPDVEAAISAGDLVTAEAILERESRGEPSPLALRRLAEVRLLAADTAGAATAYALASQADSTDGELALGAGVLLTNTGRYAEAMRHLRRAERHMPRNEPTVLYNLAIAGLSIARERVREGRTDEARAHWSSALDDARACVRYARADPSLGGIEDLVLRMGRRWGFARPSDRAVP